MVGPADRGVSQVIAVILLVGIVTVLAGFMAVYLGGFGSGMEEAVPTFAHDTSFDDDYAGNGQYLNVTHKSGAPLDTTTVSIDANGATVYDTAAGSTTGEAVLREDVLAGQVGSEFTASERLVLNRSSFTTTGGSAITGPNYVDLSDATVRFIHAPEDAQSSTVVYECDVDYPDCEDV